MLHAQCTQTAYNTCKHNIEQQVWWKLATKNNNSVPIYTTGCIYVLLWLSAACRLQCNQIFNSTLIAHGFCFSSFISDFVCTEHQRCCLVYTINLYNLYIGNGIIIACPTYIQFVGRISLNMPFLLLLLHYAYHTESFE